MRNITLGTDFDFNDAKWRSPAQVTWERGRLVPTGELKLVAVGFKSTAALFLNGLLEDEGGVLWDFPHAAFISELKPAVWPENVSAVFTFEVTPTNSLARSAYPSRETVKGKDLKDALDTLKKQLWFRSYTAKVVNMTRIKEDEMSI